MKKVKSIGVGLITLIIALAVGFVLKNIDNTTSKRYMEENTNYEISVVPNTEGELPTT